MKKIESLKLEITQNEEFALSIDCDKNKKSLGKKNKELREIIMYLEKNPNPSFIKLEMASKGKNCIMLFTRSVVPSISLNCQNK